MNVNDNVNIINVKSTTNTTGAGNSGYNGTFKVTAISNEKEFQYSTTDVDGVTYNAGSFTSDTSLRTVDLPRFTRNDLQSNYYIYRNEVITPYIKNVQDGIYHLYVLNSNLAVPSEFTDVKYSQNVVDLYPQQDKDNENDNPPAAVSFAKRSPLGDVTTNALKNSLTRESTDKFLQDFGRGLVITDVDSSAGVATLTVNRRHGLAGIVTYSDFTGGSGYPNNGTFYNVKLFNEGTSTWDGATAKVTIAGGSVTNLEVQDGGSGYEGTEKLDLDTTFTGSPSVAAAATFTQVGITTNVGEVVQITGIGTLSDGYYRITDIPSTTAISIAKTSGDPTIIPDQYILPIGPAISISSDTFDSGSGISTFTCSSGHGLVAGNKIRITDSSNNNLGDYHVRERVSVTAFSAKTDANLASAYVLKHGLTANDKTSDASGENLGARGLGLYDGQVLTLSANVTTGTSIQVQVPNSGIGTITRFPLGSYIQVDNEIMRVVSSQLTGTSLNEISVLRGALGSTKQNHSSGTLIKKVKPIPIEFRRPSIIRSSGHTFEYVGYGPGNYSTGYHRFRLRHLQKGKSS